MGVLPLQSYFGTIRNESLIHAEVLSAYFWRAPSCLSIGRSLYQTIKLMFPDFSIAKDFKCSHTKATAVLKVIAQDCWKTISAAVRETKYFSLQTDMTTDITVTLLLLCFDSSITPKDW